jgi:hypothetical protein
MRALVGLYRRLQNRKIPLLNNCLTFAMASKVLKNTSVEFSSSNQTLA